MNGEIIEKLNEEIARELVESMVAYVLDETEQANVKPYIKRLVDNYYSAQVTELSLYFQSGASKEGTIKEIIGEEGLAKRQKRFESLVDALLKNPEYKDELYKRSYEKLKASDNIHKSWGDLFTEIYEDEAYLNEIFVRLVEEQEEVEITSAKQLQELTGITEVYPEAKETTKKEAIAEANKQIEETFTQAMSWRYLNTLERMLEAGGTYNDLLKIKPKDFNLPETWSGTLASDQYSSILWAIESAFLIGEPNTSVRPDLKTIAQEIEAPYSVLMDAHKICNKWKLQS